MNSLTRREFVRKTALAAAATQLVAKLGAADPGGVENTAVPLEPAKPLLPGVVELHWLDGKAPSAQPGTTWGIPWPRGQHPRDTTFALKDSNGAAISMQSWPLAYWPEGSLKWTGHALPADASTASDLILAPGIPAFPTKPLTAIESADAIEIDTGVIQLRVAKSGTELIPQVTREGREILRRGRLVLLHQTEPGAVGKPTPFTGKIDTVTLEQKGPVRAVVRIEGKHANEAERAWLPFVVRLYLYAGGESLRVLHTIVFDGDEQHDFIRGLGVRFEVSLNGANYDRHVRFSGEGEGLFAEAVQGVTGLRRDPGEAVRGAQLAGRATPPLGTWARTVSSRLAYIPTFGDWTLFQSTSDGFDIRKRTREGFTWLNSDHGRRAGGLGYIGTPTGGAVFGLRNFWQSHPAQLDIRGATGDAAEVTLWLWAPEAATMDLRGYHDTMGEETYAAQNEGLEITYEDYEPGFDKPEGVARTSELFIWALAATPTRERLVELAQIVRTPPVMMARPEYLHACKVFGGLWSPVDSGSEAEARIEERLDFNFKFYQKQQDEHHWYGFWNYGDVMHTYDSDRHTWRYDVGGFAWDNSELSTDIWLWLYFLRTGRADVFRFAEAMTRHTGEVDVHHLGRFAPLGSRHNVLHWGCSAKQLRISTAANRRYYYYLTADERFGDLMHEQVEAVRALVRIQPGRKLSSAERPGDLPRAVSHDPNFAGVGFGTDWGAAAAAWLTEWERTGDEKVRDRLLASMRTIASQPHGFFTGSSQMNLATGAFELSTNTRANASHLNAVFGLVEVCAELVQLFDEPAFKRAWLDYCELYNATPEEQEKRLGNRLKDISLQQAHSRLTAFAANIEQEPALAARAWKEFFAGEGPRGHRPHRALETHRVTGPAVLNPVDELPFASTNGTAQWGLAAIECIALISGALSKASADVGKA